MNIKDIENEITTRTKTKKEITIELRNEIHKELPNSVQKLMDEGFENQRIPREYTLSAVLNAFGNAIGTNISLKALGYTNYPNIYNVIVGSRGDVKSEAISLAFNPIIELDNKNFDKFEELNKIFKESDGNEKPEVKQMLVLNATIEAALIIHSNNPESLGMFFDEVTLLFDNMSNTRSRDGPYWKNLLLEGFTNKVISVSRVTAKSFRIKKGCPFLIGSIQNELVYKVLETSNLVSGLVDRILFNVKLEGNTEVKKQGVSPETLFNYADLLNRALELRNSNILVELSLNIEAENIIHNFSQELVNRQEVLESPIREYLSKLNINVFKIVIIIHTIKGLASSSSISNIVTAETVSLAIKIINFYQLNFEMIIELNKKFGKVTDTSIKGVIGYAKQNGIKQKQVVDFTGYSKGQISKKWN